MEHILSNHNRPTEEDGDNMHPGYKEIKAAALKQPLLYDSSPYKIKKDLENKVGAEPQKRANEIA